MSEMSERMRRAIGQHVHIIAGSCDLDAAVRAAIEAMREPTDEMHKAMCEAYNSPIAIWDAGIKVALKPAPVDA